MTPTRWAYDALRRQFDALSEAIEEQSERRVQLARRELSDHLNQALRRIRDAESHGQWLGALLDASAVFCRRAVLLGVFGPIVRVEAARGCCLEPGTESSLAVAPAIAAAMETRDTVVALATPGEISAPVAAAFATERPEPARLYLFPLAGRQKVWAVLCAEVPDRDVVGAMELLAAMAALALESRRKEQAIGPAPEAALSPVVLRAQRLARVAVAQVLLQQPSRVRRAREQGRLYREFQAEIDSARRQYLAEFGGLDDFTDYLHLELVRTLALDREALLGAGYPGPLW